MAESTLEEYSSLRDQHLAHFFTRPTVMRHLLHMGLVTRTGDLVPEKQWRRKEALIEAQKREQEQEEHMRRLAEIENKIRKRIRAKVRRKETILGNLRFWEFFQRFQKPPDFSPKSFFLPDTYKPAVMYKNSTLLPKCIVPHSRPSAPSTSLSSLTSSSSSSDLHTSLPLTTLASSPPSTTKSHNYNLVLKSKSSNTCSEDIHFAETNQIPAESLEPSSLEKKCSEINQSANIQIEPRSLELKVNNIKSTDSETIGTASVE
ncbi:unnamed protein product, partial [Meganyctiphanes norvegica]